MLQGSNLVKAYHELRQRLDVDFGVELLEAGGDKTRQSKADCGQSRPIGSIETD